MTAPAERTAVVDITEGVLCTNTVNVYDLI